MMSGTGAGRAKFGRYKVLIVDDHPIVRRGLMQFLADVPDVEVCGGSDNMADALEQVETSRPDLVLVDLSLKDSHGIELVTAIRARYREIKTLVWSMFDEKLFAERVLHAGAAGYINKQEPVEKVLEAMRQVLRGEVYLSPQMTSLLLRRAGRGEPIEQDPVQGLSDRELEVFQMVGKGMTTQQIARKLGLSPKTIEAHREKIKTKLNLRNSAQLMQRAVQWTLEHG